jgi:hypothetical protein
MLKEIISLDHLKKEDAHDLTTLFYWEIFLYATSKPIN